MSYDHRTDPELLNQQAVDLLDRATRSGDTAQLRSCVSLFHGILALTPPHHPHRATRLYNLAETHRALYALTGQESDADQSIGIGRQAVAALQDGDPNSALIIANLSATHLLRYQRTGQPNDLDGVVEFAARAGLAPGTQLNIAFALSTLAAGYVLRFEGAGHPADLARAIDIGERALAATPAGAPHLPGTLANLGMGYLRRFEGTGHLADLARAIDVGERALAATPADSPHRAPILTNLATAYWARFGRAGRTADLESAIGFGEQAVADTGNRYRVTAMSNLAVAYHERFERTGSLADLDRAIAHHELAVAGAPDNAPDGVTYLSNLGMAYHARFERLGDTADLDRAIGHLGRAVAAAPPGHREVTTFLSNLGIAHHTRFERLGDVADLDRSVAHHERAVAATPAGHPGLARCLSNLGATYIARFDRKGDLGDMHRAVDSLERAVAALPADHPGRAMLLSNLAGALLGRFEGLGEVGDLDRAVEYRQLAVAATPDDHPDRAMHLSNLSFAHWSRLIRTGEMSDLDAAIDAGRRSVAATPDDHPDRAMRLNNLATALHQRFERSGGLHDLDRAVAHHEQAVAATPDDHPSRAIWLSNLGTAYSARARRRGGADFDNAVDLALLALAATPADHPDRLLRRFNLAQALQERYLRAGDPADLDRAVDLARETIAAVPADHPERARYLSSLGHAYRLRHRRTGDPADLDRAVDAAEGSLAATPGDHPRRAARLYLLVTCYRRRWDSGGALDRSRIARLAQEALAATTSTPWDRLRACRAVGRLAYALDEPHTARPLFDAAVELLPLVAARETSSADHEHRLGATSGLVGEAIAVHCALDDPDGAVQTGELGRAVLLASRLALRTPLADLEAEHPALARRLSHVRDALNAPDPPAMAPPGGQTLDVVDWRTRLWAEHDAVLAEIRRLPGLDRFLLPPRWDELRPTATGGAVVLLNAGLQRCDAIVVTADGPPLLVPLPGLRQADVEAWAGELTEATHDAGSFVGELRRQRVLTEVLGRLWDTTVEPVLDAVERRLRPDDGVLPRVWWMPTGLLGLLPLHAAGHPGEAGALDRVISSYTPTLRTLARVRERPAATALRRLTVALDRTPGMADLPATAAEAASLHAAHPDMPLLTNERATAARVTGALSGASWAHFACHAGTDLDAPSEGGLHLHDGVLSIAEIGRRDLREAELAYLSACSTGHVGRRHADESIHLASAFQLAGFRHVVASLWPLDDRVAAGAAEHFYRLMPDAPAADDAAVVLHRVVRDLRTEHRERPHLWASLIHSGP
ncbi:CHAT domain-containing tetratricopeptide repeat protein [Streptomyces sp. YU58]|uniref:CHAT domain-containing tetratricopeptide repeat protein n=1 Tax=Streptomyces sp. SX92 TaxID=3158972 RepID=UPI0027BA7AC9|nr:CHAT domain-containing protein [Streptomyces coralus]WLW53342.1 CHAT domain-containing protein [Streptomyces coralus]